MKTNTNTTNMNNESKMMATLGYLYDKAISGMGLPGVPSVEQIAADYLRGSDSLEEKIDRLVRYQSMKSLGTGFVTGLGGVLTLPVTIPADMASGFIIQSRMIATIALMKGYDIHDDRVRTLCYLCMVYNSAKDIVAQVGNKAMTKLLTKAVTRIPKEVLSAINRKLGVKLVTKFSQKGVIQLNKMVPVVGGFINGGVEYASTRHVARIARETFSEELYDNCNVS